MTNSYMTHLGSGKLKDDLRTLEKLEQYYITKRYKDTTIWGNTRTTINPTTVTKNSGSIHSKNGHSLNQHSSGSLGPCGWACP